MYNWPTPPRPRNNEEIDARILAAIELLNAAKNSQMGEVKVQICKAVSEMIKSVGLK